jgi:hypothetical protein
LTGVADRQIRLSRFFHTWSPWVIVVLGFFLLIFLWNSLHSASSSSGGLEFVIGWVATIVVAYEILLFRLQRVPSAPSEPPAPRWAPGRREAIVSTALQLAALAFFLVVEYYPRPTTTCSGGLSCPGSPSPLAIGLLLFLVCELLALLFLTLSCMSMTISDSERTPRASGGRPENSGAGPP